MKFDPVDRSILDRKEIIPFIPAERQEVTFNDIWSTLPNSRWKNVGRMIRLKLSDDEVITTGDGKIIDMVPPELDGTKIVRAIAFVTTVSSSGVVTVQLRNITQSLDMLTTSITIDQSENTSITAATPVVIKPNVILRSGDLYALDIDTAGTSAKGLGVHISLI